MHGFTRSAQYEHATMQLLAALVVPLWWHAAARCVRNRGQQRDLAQLLHLSSYFAQCTAVRPSLALKQLHALEET